MRKQLLRLNLTADDASVNLNDPAVTDSILKWVPHTFLSHNATFLESLFNS